ncbi:MAG: sensor hybrid histidine kinase [Acidobacteria bacterium]|nr:sensor hybrid histidine kinase [Acidobacteriota bacterium]
MLAGNATYREPRTIGSLPRCQHQHTVRFFFYTRSLIESNSDALMTIDPAGIITDVNREAEALSGCTRDELIGAAFKNYFTDPETARRASNWRCAMKR